MIDRVLAAAMLAFAFAIAGCDNSSSNLGQGFLVDGPHNGLMIPLPQNEGFAEILNQEATSAGSRQRGRLPRMIVVYFLGADKKSALSTAPTAVSVKFLGETAGTEGPAISLSPAADPKDPAGAMRFTSAAGDYDLARRRAKLTADLVGGQKLDEGFVGMR